MSTPAGALSATPPSALGPLPSNDGVRGLGTHRVRQIGFALALAAAGACSSNKPPAPLTPPPVDLGSAELHALGEGSDDLFFSIPDPDYVSPDDIIFNSPLLRNREFWDEVQSYMGFWTDGARPWFPRCLEGMGWFEAMVDSALVANSLPRSLRYLPVLESCYLPNAVSTASAVGLWQFMAPTARGLGLEVGSLVDERRDPYAATDAAMRFLTYLHERFDSWFLALAAYNGGPNRVARLIRTHAPLLELSDDVFWAIRDYLPRETRTFVAKFYSGMLVARSPTTHGYRRAGENGFRFDEVEVPDATSLDVVARAAGASVEEIARLNPKYVRGITPPGLISTVRVPEGSGAGFREAWESIPPDERRTFVEHAVVRGETLSHIARRYGVSVAELQAANPDVRPRYLRVGSVLVVPVVPGWGS